jgi:hypothetical protein
LKVCGILTNLQLSTFNDIMNLRTALATVHRDRLWWRKILIGGALMLTIFGYPWAAGLEMESLENTRKGFPTPLPPWRDWSLRYLIGLFAVLIDILFFGLPIFAAGLLFLCIGTLLVTTAGALSVWLLPIGGGALLLYQLAMFAVSVSPVGRLIYAETTRPEDALGMRTVRAALGRRARRIYLRARLQSLPAYLPAVLFALVSWYAIWPYSVLALWLMFSGLLYAHLVVVQLYAAAESDIMFG